MTVRRSPPTDSHWFAPRRFADDAGAASAAAEGESKQLSELMERYARGEDGVFELLYKLAAPRLYRFCLRLTATRSEADDLLQDTFLRLHRARATYMRGANVLHWAFAIARSAYLDRLRYWRRRPEDLGASNDASENERLHADARYSPEAEARAHEAAEIVKRELSKMSEKNRVAYILLREEGLSVKEAAALLGATADVVKQRAHRAHEHLRNALAAAGWTEYSSDASASSADAEYIGRSALADVGDSSW